MYYFTIDGVECRCDTAEELRAVVGRRATAPRKAMTAAKAAKNGADGKFAIAARPAIKSTEDEAVRKLPYVGGPLTWNIVKKIGKQLGRNDVRELRSDLKTRQKMGE